MTKEQLINLLRITPKTLLDAYFDTTTRSIEQEWGLPVSTLREIFLSPPSKKPLKVPKPAMQVATA